MSARINTLFYWCNDIGAMRRFYTDVLALKETYFNADAGWLTYDLQGLQLVFMRGARPLPIESAWARQPAWTEGTAEIASIVIQFSTEDFDAVLARIKTHDIQPFSSEPRGDGKRHRMQFVRDPMGRTVELYCELVPS